MEQVLAQIGQAILSEAFKGNNAGNTSITNPNTNSGKSISQLMKGA